MATGTRLTRAESKARTRAELVAAARRVFLERGYHGASLDAVADTAGFSTGAVYSTFAGKADLFLAVLDDHLSERIRRIEEAGARASSPEEQAEALAREFASAGRQNRAWSPLVIEFWAHAARDPALQRQFALRHDALKAAIARVIDEMLERTGRRLKLGTEEVAMAAAALANGLTLERLAQPDGVSDELFSTISVLVMKGLTGDAKARATR